MCGFTANLSFHQLVEKELTFLLLREIEKDCEEVH